MQPTPAQLLIHAKAELGRIERQMSITASGCKLLNAAMEELKREDGGLDAIRIALINIIQFQLGPSELAFSEMAAQHDKLVEYIKQARSPIASATLIPPNTFGRRG